MKCPRCDAWSEVAETRQQDGGHRNNRTRRCANGHRFVTVEVHRAVWCSAKQRQATFLGTVRKRANLHARNAQIARMLAAGQLGKDVAAALGVSPDTVSLVKKATAQ